MKVDKGIGKMHWGGGIRLPCKRMLPGWPCCCSGKRADRITNNGRITYDPKQVTCLLCQKIMEEQDKDEHK